MEKFNALELKQCTVESKVDTMPKSKFSDLNLLKSECHVEVEEVRRYAGVVALLVEQKIFKARRKLLQNERSHTKQVVELLKQVEKWEEKVLQQGIVVRNLLVRKYLAVMIDSAANEVCS